MDVLQQFGFDLRLFFAQVVNFLIILFVFKKFFYKPLLKVLDSREKKIAQGLKDAELAAQALERAEEQKENIIKKAGIEAEKILHEAREQSNLAREEMIAKTKEEIERMMLSTKQQIELERENFKKESKEISLEIAKSILSSTIDNLFDKKANESLTRKGLQKIKNV